MKQTAWETSGDLRDYWRFSDQCQRERDMAKFTGSPGMARLAENTEPSWQTTPIRAGITFSRSFERRIGRTLKKQSDAEIAREFALQQKRMAEQELAKQAVEKFRADLPTRRGWPLIREIISEMAKYYHFTYMDMISARRFAPLSKARHEAMLLSRAMTPHSFPEIGRRFGNRDHSTIIHGVQASLKRNGLHKGPWHDVDWLRVSEWANARFDAIVAENTAGRCAAE